MHSRLQALASLALFFLLGQQAHASGPLAIPPWATLRAFPEAEVELGRSARWVVELEAHAGAVLADPPVILERPGLHLGASPNPESAQWAHPGAPARWTVRLRLDAHPEGTCLDVAMNASCPREALQNQAREAYSRASPQSLKALLKTIHALPKRQALRARVVPDLLPEEGTLPGAPPRYRLYIQVQNARLAAWNPPLKKGMGAAREALVSASPSLRRLLTQAGVQEQPDGGRSRYRSLLTKWQRRERALSLPLSLARLAKDPGSSPEVIAASLNLMAIGAARAGDLPTALNIWQRLSQGSGPRHYFQFNRGEWLRVNGKLIEARKAFAEALRLRPVYTLARERLHSLKER
jgi:tetratricopeptide (TPR) repeat protein